MDIKRNIPLPSWMTVGEKAEDLPRCSLVRGGKRGKGRCQRVAKRILYLVDGRVLRWCGSCPLEEKNEMNGESTSLGSSSSGGSDTPSSQGEFSSPPCAGSLGDS